MKNINTSWDTIYIIAKSDFLTISVHIFFSRNRYSLTNIMILLRVTLKISPNFEMLYSFTQVYQIYRNL